MRIPRVYTPQTLSVDSSIDLESQASNHLGRVLRMSENDPVELFNGNGRSYDALIINITKKCVTLKVTATQHTPKQSPLQTHLGLAMSKGDRMDYAIQKATELGIHEITPLMGERSELKLKGERAEKKVQHWMQVAVSSCEQCQRNILPKINPIKDLNAWINEAEADLKLVLHHRAEQQISDLPKPSSVAFLIGPEGGLSESEIDMAINKNFEPLLLGPRVLRTETAPVVLLSTAQLLWGDF